MPENNPWKDDYHSVEHVGPDEGDSAQLYASYIAGRGITAMVVVARLREEFGLGIAEAWDVLRRAIGPHGNAFLREVELIEGLREYGDDHALARKVARNIGLESSEALSLVENYRAKAAK